MKAVSAFLDSLPIAYTMRIETTGSQVFQHTHVVPEQHGGGSAELDARTARLLSAVSPYGVRGRHGQ